MSFLGPALVAALVALAAALAWLARPRRLLAPGPRPRWLYGNLPDLATHPGGPHLALSRLAERHGPVMGLQLGQFQAVVLSEGSVVHEALVKQSQAFAGRPALLSTDALSKGGRDLVFADFTPEWRAMKKLAHAQLFGMAQIRRQEHKIVSAGAALVERLGAGGDVREAFKLTAFNIVFDVLCGRTFPDSADPALQTMFAATTDVFKHLGSANAVDYLPWLRFVLPGKAEPVRRLERAAAHLASLVQPELDRRAEGTFVDILLRAIPDDDERVVLFVADMLLAGTDTGSTTMEWLSLLLALHPDVQERVHKEARECGEITSDSELPYLRAVLQEVWRFRTVVPLTRRRTTQDVRLAGVRIPRGTLVLVNQWRLHHDPAAFADPDVFDPERFLRDPPEQQLDTGFLMPFGVGMRQCTGANLGRAEARILAATVFRDLRVEPAGDIDLEPQYAQTLRPKGMPVRFIRRAGVVG